jgi:hypothetical protein
LAQQRRPPLRFRIAIRPLQPPTRRPRHPPTLCRPLARRPQPLLVRSPMAWWWLGFGRRDRKRIGGERYRRGLGEAAEASGHRVGTVSIRRRPRQRTPTPLTGWTRKRWARLQWQAGKNALFTNHSECKWAVTWQRKWELVSPLIGGLYKQAAHSQCLCG